MTKKWGEVNCFLCRAGDGRKLRLEAGPPEGVRLSIERDLDKTGEETRESRDRHVKGVLHIQDRKSDGFSKLRVITRKKREIELRKDTAFTCVFVIRTISRAEQEREQNTGEEGDLGSASIFLFGLRGFCADTTLAARGAE